MSKRSQSEFPLVLMALLTLFTLVVSIWGPETELASRFLQSNVVTGNSGPEFASPYVTRRVCVDRVHDGIATSTLNRAGYLNGGELVGVPETATDPDGDTLASYLGIEDEDRNFMFFDYATSSGQLFVSAARRGRPPWPRRRPGLSGRRDHSRRSRQVGCHNRGHLARFLYSVAERRRSVSVSSEGGLMTHDCDRAAECPCYQAGYLNGQQTGEWTLADSLELTAGRMVVAALTIPPAIYLAAVWLLEWEALAFASRVLFIGMAAMAATGYGLRAWRRG